jgi:hypothetical protein
LVTPGSSVGPEPWAVCERSSRHPAAAEARNDLFDLSLGLVRRLEKNLAVVGFSQVPRKQSDATKVDPTSSEQRQNHREATSRSSSFDAIVGR